jgi:flagellar protein FliS
MSRDSQIDAAGSLSLAERGRLLLALYEGGLGFLEHAVAAHERRDFEHFSNCIGRAQRVINELAATLDHGQAPELATMLGRLYEFMIFQLTEAERTRDAESVRQEMDRLRQIYDSYRRVIMGVDQEGASAPVDSDSTSR